MQNSIEKLPNNSTNTEVCFLRLLVVPTQTFYARHDRSNVFRSNFELQISKSLLFTRGDRLAPLQTFTLL